MNDYFLYALILAYSASKPKQPKRAEEAFRQAILEGVEANKHVLGVLSRAVGSQRAHQLAQELGVPSPSIPYGSHYDS